MSMEMHCSVDLDWSASDNAGTVATPMGDLPYSALGPAAIGGNGASPEALLIAAIASCYSITLSNVLRDASLPQTRVSVRAEGVIASDCGKPRFTRVTVHPTIRGADVPQQDAYEKAAAAAREACLIGRSIRGNVAYVVGEVSLLDLTQ
jgi:peroxiredoxin-like protein